eukprot:TRINITY_DN19529_c0_g1_i1.p1 TRINITY_DN19529_c0_g1~~TRINITY_DN19529_c0_g1_i1.p1  ORF type:complete len:113 (-),score=0.94 TRINITY_DN19529_c0_g1_i1:100-438(-)
MLMQRDQIHLKSKQFLLQYFWFQLIQPFLPKLHDQLNKLILHKIHLNVGFIHAIRILYCQGFKQNLKDFKVKAGCLQILIIFWQCLFDSLLSQICEGFVLIDPVGVCERLFV